MVLKNHTDPTGKSEAQTFQVPLSVLVSKDKERFQLLFSKIDCDIVSACRDLEPLSSVLRGHTGIRARSGQKSVVTDHQVTDLHRPGLISGSELHAFEINWAGNSSKSIRRNYLLGVSIRVSQTRRSWFAKQEIA